ncbi:transporter substrate-binding domain-containing protein [Ferrimonas senticii]|uniref:transporter substrate-binding domain-containing protein n=1 Tax=Ferrimonas senticii TaxID=394566 RepID=UPI0003F76322|nr:transporter substrate-binding domain-containing protein [Ferrimonas senticii]
MLRLLLCLIVLLAAAFGSYAAPAHPTPSPKRLLVGLPENEFAPYTIRTADGDLTGLFPDLMRLYAEQIDSTVEFVALPHFSDVLAAFQRGEIDVMIGVSSTLDRRSYMSFSEPLLAVKRLAVSRQPLASSTELAQATIATVNSFSDSAVIANYLLDAKPIELPTPQAALNAVAKGIADAQIGDAILLSQQWQQSSDKQQLVLSELKDLPLDINYLSVAPNQTELLAKLNQAITTLANSPQRQAILERWLSAAQLKRLQQPNQLNLTQAERDWLAAQGTITIAVEGDSAPLEFVDMQQNFRGISIDVLNEISALTGLQFKITATTLHRNKLKGFWNNQYQMLAGLSSTPLRRHTMLFTQPYLSEPWGAIGRSSEHQFALSLDVVENDAVIGIVRDSYGSQMAKRYCNNCPLQPYDDISELLEATNNGEVDLAVASLYRASNQLQQHYLGQLKVISSVDRSAFIPVSFAIHKADPLMLQVINKALAAIPPSRYREIEQRWRDHTQFNNGLSRDDIRRWLTHVGVLLLLLTLAVVSWTLAMRREVSRRKAVEKTLEQQLQQQRAMLDAIPVPLLLSNAQGELQSCNQAAKRLYGLKPTQKYFASDADELPDWQRQLLRGALESQPFNNNQSINKELQLQIEQQSHHLNLKQAAYRDKQQQILGVISVIQDHTTLRQAEQQAQAAQAQMGRIADIINGAVIQHLQLSDNPNDVRFLYASNGVRNLFNINPKTLLDSGQGLLHLVVPEMRVQMVHAMRDAISRGSMSQQTQLFSNGRKQWVTIQAQVEQQGEHYLWTTILTDSSSLQQQHWELEQARKAADTASQMKSRLLANISADIHIPIKEIIEQLALASTCPKPAGFHGIYSNLNQSAHKLLSLSQDLQQLSSLAAEQSYLTFNPVEIRPMLTELLQPHIEEAARKGVSVLHWIDPQIGTQLTFDKSRFSQALNHLLGNAIKQSAGKPLNLTCELQRQQDGKQQLRFTLHCQWPMPRDGSSDLFPDSPDQLQQQSQALGLPLCRQLLNLLSASIELNLQPDFSTVVTISLSADLVQAATSPDLSCCRALLAQSTFEAAIFSDAKRHLENWHASVSTEALADHQQLRELCQQQQINLLVIATEEYQRLQLDGTWLQQHLPNLRCILLEKRSQAAPQLRHGHWSICAKPLLPQHLLSAIGNPNAIDDQQVASSQADHYQQGREQAIANGRLLLVVEDHPVNRRIIMTKLQQLGFYADSVSDGQQALLALAQQRYGLLITECYMPNMDGFALVKQIRRREFAKRLPRLPVIALSANNQRGDDLRCISAGMDAYLTKSVELEQLRDIVNSWLPTESEAVVTPETAETALLDINLVQTIYGDPLLTEQLLQDFVQCQNDDLTLLSQAIEQRQHHQVKLTAHRMAGAAKMLSCSALVEPLEQLQRASVNGHNYQACLRQVQLRLAQLQQQLHSRYAEAS